MPQSRLSAFNQSDYRSLLRTLRDLGYRDVPLHRAGESGQTMFLRHDIDVCLESAEEMAQVESEEGVSATYYFLLSTRLYNLASAESRARLARIAERGHTIALHFDATQYSGDRVLLEQQAEEECQILEKLTGNPVTSISFHRPVKEFLGLPGAFAGRRHTYEPRFFEQIGYLSDSNGGWHHGHPLDHPAVKAGEAIQLLTHPVWWMHDERQSAIEAVENLRGKLQARTVEDLAATVTAYRKWLQPDETASPPSAS